MPQNTDIKLKHLSETFVKNLKNAIISAGSQKKMAEMTGIHQSRISGYLNGCNNFSGISIGTLIKLFPETTINYAGKINEAAAPDNLIEQRILILLRRMPPEKQIILYENIAKFYGDSFTESKPEKSGEEK